MPCSERNLNHQGRRGVLGTLGVEDRKPLTSEPQHDATLKRAASTFMGAEEKNNKEEDLMEACLIYHHVYLL